MKRLCVVTAVLAGFCFPIASADDQEIKLSDCPQAVRKTFQAEAKGAKIETVTREREADAEGFTGLSRAGRQEVRDRHPRGRHAHRNELVRQR